MCDHVAQGISDRGLRAWRSLRRFFALSQFSVDVEQRVASSGTRYDLEALTLVPYGEPHSRSWCSRALVRLP